MRNVRLRCAGGNRGIRWVVGVNRQTGSAVEGESTSIAFSQGQFSRPTYVWFNEDALDTDSSRDGSHERSRCVVPSVCTVSKRKYLIFSKEKSMLTELRDKWLTVP